MDALGAYGSDSDSDGGSPGGESPPAPASLPSAAGLLGGSGLPDASALLGGSGLPDASALLGGSGLPDASALLGGSFGGVGAATAAFGGGGGGSGGKKRPLVSPTGGVKPGVAKAARAPGSAGPGFKASAAMLPPQLRGRSNVVTEDLDKMGLKARAKRPPAE